MVSPGGSTPVSAYAGYVAWSEKRDETYVLRVRDPSGAITDAGVAPRAVPFDVSLGRDDTEQVVASYSRCEVEPERDTVIGGGQLPAYWLGQGCRSFATRPGSGVESRLRLGTKGSTYFPSVWDHRVAYAVANRDRRRAYGAVRIRDLRAETTSKVRGGRRETAGSDPPGFFRDPGPLRLLLRGRRLAFGWRYVQDACPKPSSLLYDVGYTTEIRVASISAADTSRLVASACIDNKPGQSVLAGLRRGVVYHATITHSSGPRFRTALHATSLRSRRTRFLARLADQHSLVESLSVDGHILYRTQKGQSDDDVTLIESSIP